MALSVDEIITQAREARLEFTPEAHPDLVLLHYLSGLQRDLTGRATRTKPHALSAVVTITLPLADFDAGYTLPAFQRVLGGTVYPTSSSWPAFPLHLVPWQERLNPGQWRSAYVDGATPALRLCFTATEWGGYDHITLEYVPLPAALAAVSDAFALPDTAETALVDGAIAFLATRDPKVPLVEVERRLRIAAQSAAAWLEQLGASVASVSTTQSEW
jgi:hypothetical protein